MANIVAIEQYAGQLYARFDDGSKALAHKLSSGNWSVEAPEEQDTPGPRPPNPPPDTGGGDGKWRWPFGKGAVFNGFGPRSLDGFHYGIDFGNPPALLGATIRACGPGTVIQSGWNDGGWFGAGNMVGIDHGTISGDRYYSFYFHMRDAPRVSRGAKVTSATVIGVVGNTGYSFGAHLHFQINKNGQPGNTQAIDPSPFMRARGATGW